MIMKTKFTPQTHALLALILSTLVHQPSTSLAQGTAFSYQGRLNDGANPASGIYDLRFTLYDSTNNPGVMVGGPVTNSAIAISSGLFTVTLDFGAPVFDGQQRWLEVAAQTNGGSAFSVLSPRQPITATPYAIKAASAMTVNMGIISNPVFLGTTNATPLEFFVNNQRVLRLEDNVDGSDVGLTPDGAPNVIGGSAGNLVGTGVVGATIAGGGATNWLGIARANIVLGDYGNIGGGLGNRIDSNTVVATIAGGVDNDIGVDSDYSVIGGGFNNNISNSTFHATIAGGVDNDIGTFSTYSAIGGGQNNNVANNAPYGTISGGGLNDIGTNSAYSAIGGGQENNIQSSAPYSTIAGGTLNDMGSNSFYGTVGGGYSNRIASNAQSSVIPGGRENAIGADAAFAFAAGRRAKANHSGSFVWADQGVGSAGTDFTSTTSNQFLIRATGGVGINTNATAGAALTVAGTVQATSFVGAGGSLSNVNASTLGGLNLSNFWQRGGNAGTTAGTSFLGTTDNQPLELKVNGQRVFRLEPNSEIAPNVIGGASVNHVAPGVVGATIGGGGTLNYLGLGNVESNSVLADFGTIGGGWSNVVRSTGVSATVAGGFGNVADGPDATVGGGFGNEAGGSRGTVAGGFNNRASGDWSAIGGGGGNVVGNLYGAIAGGSANDVFGNYSAIGGGSGNLVEVGGNYSVVSGGQDNVVALTYANIGGGRQNTNVGTYSAIGGGRNNDINFPADYSVIAGGRDNTVEADYAFAAGRGALATHNGTFVWADATDATFPSLAINEFAVRASGGARIIGSPTNGALLVAPNETLDGEDSQILLAEDHDGTFGMLFKYDGIANQLQILGKTAGGPTSPHLIMERNSGNVGIQRSPTANQLEVEGTASKTTAGSWLANSDARIKKDIQPVTDALAKLGQVRLVSFRYADDYRQAHASIEDRPYLNVVAQEFRKVFPEHVRSSGEKLADGSEMLQVDTYPLTIYSAAAVQELNHKMEVGNRKSEASIQELRAENAELKQAVNELKQLVVSLSCQLNGGAK